MNGTPWEYKRNRTGKLVLIDFWSTTCIYCKESMPVLSNWQTKYGNKGLEVLGIAVESGGRPQEQAASVDMQARRLKTNYRHLLSGTEDCPVRHYFQVTKLPTMVLVDQNGTIIRRYEGAPDRAKLDELERLIQLKLNAR